MKSETGPAGAANDLNRLILAIKPLDSLAVGFSGGVDSSVVVAAAVEALGTGNVVAVTSDSETLPVREMNAACHLARKIGCRHEIIRTRELDMNEFAANPPDRCYYCKTELWKQVRKIASELGLKNIADGVNASDLGDFRPGIRAGDECGVAHPLAAIGAGKEQVRGIARQLGLPNWDKPAEACLSSRFPYGKAITAAGLKRVEQAEELLKEHGFGQLRVRDHGNIARIEVPPEMLHKLTNGSRLEIVKGLKELGYSYVTVDLEGFRSGSMNETLKHSF